MFPEGVQDPGREMHLVAPLSPTLRILLRRRGDRARLQVARPIHPPPCSEVVGSPGDGEGGEPRGVKSSGSEFEARRVIRKGKRFVFDLFFRDEHVTGWGLGSIGSCCFALRVFGLSRLRQKDCRRIIHREPTTSCMGFHGSLERLEMRSARFGRCSILRSHAINEL